MTEAPLLTRPVVEKGDVFRDRRSGIEREVLYVHTTPRGATFAYCHGYRHSEIRVDRLLDQRLYERLWPPWKAIEDTRAADGAS